LGASAAGALVSAAGAGPYDYIYLRKSNS